VPTLRGKVSRQQFPAGRDGQALVLDTASPHGIAWRSGIDRLITDITPELSGSLDCNSFDLTSVGNIGFSAVTGTLAGIQNQNLLDKSATETVAGAWTFGAALTVATPSAATDAASKGYVDTAVGATPLDRAWLHANYTKALATPAVNNLALNTDHWFTPTTWTVRDSNNWTHSSGEFTYGGAFPASGTRKFLVSWALSAQGWATKTVWNTKVRVTKDTGSGHVVVPGSTVSSNWYGWLALFGLYFERPEISGSCIVSIDSGDKIGLDWGVYCLNSFGGTFNLSGWLTQDDGIIVTITPVDINP
jgi:hypothetical protein